MAGFPVVKTLENFDYKSSSLNQSQIRELSTLHFIDRCENILLLGPEGFYKAT